LIPDGLGSSSSQLLHLLAATMAEPLIFPLLAGITIIGIAQNPSGLNSIKCQKSSCPVGSQLPLTGPVL
jgi:hypothetical protein